MKKRWVKNVKRKKTWNGRIIIVAVLVLVAAIVISLFALRAARRAAYPLTYLNEVSAIARTYDLPVSLVMGVIHTESSFDEKAVSSAGAVGLMQIMPDTGQWISGKLDIDDFDASMLLEPTVNIEMGCWYIRYLYDAFDGDINAVLAGYNAGQNRVRKWLEDSSYTDGNGHLATIPIEEAKDYVEKVLYAQKNYQQIYRMD